MKLEKEENGAYVNIFDEETENGEELTHHFPEDDVN